MSYHPNIPQANDNPTVSQRQFLDNFIKLNSDFSINHVPFTAGGNKGFHTLVQIPSPLEVIPDLVGLESLLYTDTSINPLDSTESVEFFFKNSEATRQLTKLPYVNGTITDVTPGANGVVTSSDRHLLTTGADVTIQDVEGITGINNMTFTITVLNITQFELNDAVGGAYTSGGTWTSPSSTRYGFMTPWNWIINTGTIQPAGTTIIPYSIPYPIGFLLYGGWLTPFTGVTQFGLQSPTETHITMTTSNNPLFYYLIIGSGS